MSRWSLAALVLAAACGGSSTKPPEPIGNMAPQSQDPVVETSGGADPGGSGGTADRDGDGLADGGDACFEDPEDFDAFEDEDGCPEPDNDHDGILDIDDLCPNEPEDRDANQDEDGCPEP